MGPVEQPRRLILLGGTAGTGKRTVAAFLAAEHGFRHLDLSAATEADPDPALLGDALGQVLLESGHDVIVTCPAPSVQLVDLLRALGFEWIWFDSDRGAARPTSPVTSSETMACAKGQGEPCFVETFEADGSFRPLDDVAADLLSAGRPRAAGQSPQSPKCVSPPHSAVDAASGRPHCPTRT